MKFGYPRGIPQFHAEAKTFGLIKLPNLITSTEYYATRAELFLL